MKASKPCASQACSTCPALWKPSTIKAKPPVRKFFYNDCSRNISINRRKRLFIRRLFVARTQVCFLQARDQPLTKDVCLRPFARPTRAVEHRERHREGVMLAGAVAREFTLAGEIINDLYTLPRRRFVFEAEPDRKSTRLTSR